MKILLLVVTASMAVAGLVIAQGASGTFSDGFTGAPPSPQSVEANAASWDVQVHSRDTNTWYSLESMQAQHGSDCSAPPATHSTNSYEGAVFQCKDHIMTAINTTGYGVIYLTPNQLIDISSGGTVSFDISTERMSKRDWWDIWVTPYADNIALPFQNGDVDLAGAPRNAVHIGIDNAESAPVLTTYSNGNGTMHNSGGNTPSTTSGIVAGTNQSAVRQTMRLTLSPTRVKFERLASATATAVVFFDRTIPALSWSQGVVQFGHHSYTPTKDGAGVPATWHWDNFSVSPAEPFTIIKADRRFVDSASQVLTFAQPAPANGMLRFSAIGRPEVSFDGGPFSAAQRQFATQNGAHPEHFSNYWTPVPVGAKTVKFRFTSDGWYTTGYPMMAKDFAIFSSSAPGSVPLPTATAPASATATPTGPAATATATPTGPAATATPTRPAATATATPPAPAATATATPTRPAATATATPTRPAGTATATPTRPAGTATPTVTRTATPTTTPTPGPITGRWTTSATISPSPVSPGMTMNVKATVTSPGTGSALVDIEIFDTAGKRVLQKVFDNSKFTAGVPVTFNVAYAVPSPAGTASYTVKIGIFQPGWGTLYSWNNAAATVRVR